MFPASDQIRLTARGILPWIFPPNVALRVLPLALLKIIDLTAPEPVHPKIGTLPISSIKTAEASTETSLHLALQANVREPAVLRLVDQPLVDLSLIVTLHSTNPEIGVTGALHTRPEAGSLAAVALAEDLLAVAETIVEESAAVPISPEEDVLDPLYEDVLEVLVVITTVTEVPDIDPGLHLGTRRPRGHLQIPLTHEAVTA